MVRRVIGWSTLVVAIVAITAFFASPWPSVWIIRSIFDKGAADASSALAKHLPGDVVTRAGIHYVAGDADAILDIHRSVSARASAPTIVWIHGGGFVSGRRADIDHYLKILAGRGFTTVNVDYTIAPDAVYPTPVRQVARAVALLDQQAQQLGINSEAFVLAGDSADAQIAAQVANLITSPGYAGTVGIEAPIKPEQLKGALLYCGVYDVETLDRGQGGVFGWFLHTVTWSYSGARDWRGVRGFETMSVARYVTPQFPPTFISAGNADPLRTQSVQMEKALRSNGVVVESLFFSPEHEPKLQHEYQFNLDGADGQQALARTTAWLEGLESRPSD